MTSRAISNSTRASLLRWSLLTSLGYGVFACGSNVATDPSGSSGTAGNSSGTAGNSSGTAGNSSGTAGTGGIPHGGGGGAGPTATCTASTATDGNVNTCAEGFSHRPKATACELSQAASGGAGGAPMTGEGGESDGAPLPRADGSVDCQADASVCDAFLYGYCNHSVVTAVGDWACLSGCVTDADCGSGQICVCDGPSPTGGICVSSTCSTDADCEPGMLCASVDQACTQNLDKPNFGAFACQELDDECRVDADCPLSPGCHFDGERRSCVVGVCGRPFLVGTDARVAGVVSSQSWQAPALLLPKVEQLTPVERQTLAEHWTKMGQLEHASIAAFARFSLQLLALGAPAELVEACNRALADETAHTKLCFGIASAYAGRCIGPAALDISGSLQHASLLDVVDLVIAEGCFGETGAALEALEAASMATDPAISAAYALIGPDEERHAELAFRFVRWALQQDAAGVSSRIRAALASDLARTRAAREITVPCLLALLTNAGSSVAAVHAWGQSS